MSRRSHGAHWAAAALVMGAIATGCSTSTTEAPSASVPPSAAAVEESPAQGQAVRLETELTSDFQDLSRVGADDSRVYGWNLLVGQSTFQEVPVTVRLQGSVSYLDGNGPFGGFITLVAEDGSQLAMLLNGEATRDQETTFDGTLEFIGASGQFADLSAQGAFRGSRTAEVGAPVLADLDLVVGVSPSAASSATPGE